ncbi:DUF6458 family protein [Polymorphospora lycopeni]|uniref:DUF6458 family protein n=1 Tax=Polymorphospora lycopeni TaxID=3140240 RepID=A0ABV5CI22_9ACTN
MGIGGSILLIAIGAIFAFALDVNLGWLNINVVGWVLMVAGVVGLILTTWFWQSRRRAVVQTAPAERQVAPIPQDRVVHEYREVRNPGPTV